MGRPDPHPGGWQPGCLKTMAEKRTKAEHILLKFQGKTVKIELFDATLWDHPDAAPGLVRIRQGSITSGRWVQVAPGEKAAMFFDREGLARILAAALREHSQLLDVDAGRPDLFQGQRVRVWPNPNSRKTTFGCTKTFAASDPIRCFDGQWRILISSVGLVLCDQVEGLDRFGRSIPQEASA